MNTFIRTACILAMTVMGTAGQRTSVAPPQDFIIGADISGVQAAEARGIKYSDKGVTKDILTILKDHGFNYGRLRLLRSEVIISRIPLLKGEGIAHI